MSFAVGDAPSRRGGPRRSLLALSPQGSHLVVGTTDSKTQPELHHAVPEGEIDWILQECECHSKSSLIEMIRPANRA